MVPSLELNKRPHPAVFHVMICWVLQHDLCLAIGLLFSIDSEGNKAAVKAHHESPGGTWELEAFLLEILLAPRWWLLNRQPDRAQSEHRLALLLLFQPRPAGSGNAVPAPVCAGVWGTWSVVRVNLCCGVKLKLLLPRFRISF